MTLCDGVNSLFQEAQSIACSGDEDAHLRAPEKVWRSTHCNGIHAKVESHRVAV